MIYAGEAISGIPLEAVLAHIIMSENDSGKRSSIRGEWNADTDGGRAKHLFLPEELDIYVNKVTLEAYIFHSKKVEYDTLERLEYDPSDYSVAVVKKDGTRMDLGVKIQWLVRPYFTKANEIHIVQTKDGESINGTVVPLVHKGAQKAAPAQ